MVYRYVETTDAVGDGDKDVPTNYQSTSVKNQILPSSVQKDLAKHLAALCDKFYGVTVEQCRRMAYDIALANKVDIPLSWVKNQMAGYDWYLTFRRQKGRAIRLP